MSASLTTLIDSLDGLLDPTSFSDFGPNGLQVPRVSPDVETVVTGVSAHGPLLERAAAEGADLVLVHHGMFWKNDPLGVDAAQFKRLKLLFDHDMALAAYHLPLDAHPEHGNNAIIAARLGLEDVAPFAGIGVQGRVPGGGWTVDELAVEVAAVCGRRPLVVPGGPEVIRRMSVLSGGGTDYARDAVALGLDAHLTGEPAERAFAHAHDAGIHFLAAGHHATETFGVNRLGELLAERFGIRHVHIDVANPI